MSDNGRKEVTPMPKITDEQYRYLSRAVYFVGKFPHQYRKGRMVTIHGRKYVVEDVESNEKNGLQALAVTPEDAPDELVIAYGGTDPADIRDALTDIEFIALGREHRPLEDGRDRLREVIAENPRVQEIISRLGLDGTALLAARGSGDSQAASALKFAHRAAGGRTFTTTGHSLGASLAIYVAVKLRMSSICFNGPDISAILSAEECACIRSHPYEFRNYHNPGDIIGNVTPDRLDCAITAAGQRASLDILACHSLRSWHFSESGSVTAEDGRPLLGEEELSFCRKMQSGDPACSTFASFVSAASDRAVSEVRASSEHERGQLVSRCIRRGVSLCSFMNEQEVREFLLEELEFPGTSHRFPRPYELQDRIILHDLAGQLKAELTRLTEQTGSRISRIRREAAGVLRDAEERRNMYEQEQVDRHDH